jgi:ABC-type antimicrobial peptide transport system permease subunit
MPVTEATMMEDTLDGMSGFWGFRLGAWMSGAMGFVGLALAIVGVYGVVSYAAGQRTQEIGIRMALGAESRDVLRLVVRQGIAMVASGILIGLATAALLARLMTRGLYGTIQPTPISFISATVFLALVALCACYIPARRAVRLDPMRALWGRL